MGGPRYRGAQPHEERCNELSEADDVTFLSAQKPQSPMKTDELINDAVWMSGWKIRRAFASPGRIEVIEPSIKARRHVVGTLTDVNTDPSKILRKSGK